MVCQKPSALWTFRHVWAGVNAKDLTVSPADLTGKWVVVTGGNNGIGREASLQFAAWGANLVLACRNPPPHELHPDVTVADCKAAATAAGHTKSSIEWWPVDMSDLASITAFTQRWLATERQCDILVNNAGVASTKACIKTKDGFELVHQINFLSHTLVTLAFLPSLAKAPAPRVVMTTSNLHYTGSPDLSHANDGGDEAYPNAKLYLQTWLTELQSRLLKIDEYRHITVQGVHPGFVNSGIWEIRKETATNIVSKFLIWIVMILVNRVGVNVQQGSLTIINAATAPEAGPDPVIQGVGDAKGRGGGRFWNRTWELEANPYSRDEEFRLKVWALAKDELKFDERKLLTKLE